MKSANYAEMTRVEQALHEKMNLRDPLPPSFLAPRNRGARAHDSVRGRAGAADAAPVVASTCSSQEKLGTRSLCR